MRLQRQFVLPAIAIAALLPACSSIAEQATERLAEEAAGGDVDIDVDEDGDGSFRVESSEGSLEIGGGELPESFPGSLPLPSEYEVMTAMTVDNADESGFTVALSTTDDFESLRESFESALESGGWEIADTRTMSSNEMSSVNFQIANGDLEGMVSIQQLEDEVMVNYLMGDMYS